MIKKILSLLAFIGLLVCLTVCASAQVVELGVWQFECTNTVYSYDLSECRYNVSIFKKAVIDGDKKTVDYLYATEDGEVVQKWNVLTNGASWEGTSFYRIIPLEYAELYTRDGKRVCVEKKNVDAGDWTYVYTTEDGTKVIGESEYIQVSKDGTGLWEKIYRIAEECTITFSCAKSDGSDMSFSVYETEFINIPKCSYKRDGYVFSHWTDGSENFIPGQEYHVQGSIIMNAVWDNDTTIQPSVPNEPTTPSKPSASYTSPYTDISNHWANDIIQYIDKLGLIDHATSTTFAPDKPMTREVFVTAMARLAGVESDYINWAIEFGLLKGYGDGEYGLNDTITREQMAVFFLRFLELTDVDYEACKTVANYKFTDDAQIADWAKDAVYEMQALDLIHGKGNGIFDPKGLTTRAEGATVLYNMCKTVLKK